MSPPDPTPSLPTEPSSSGVREDTIEYGFIGTLQKLKYEYRPDITNRATLEANFREKFEALNRVRLTDAEFARLLDEITTTAALVRRLLSDDYADKVIVTTIQKGDQKRHGEAQRLPGGTRAADTAKIRSHAKPQRLKVSKNQNQPTPFPTLLVEEEPAIRGKSGSSRSHPSAEFP